MTWLHQPVRQFRGFLFCPASDTWLFLLRAGMGVVVVVYCLSLQSQWNDFFAAENKGLINRHLSETLVASISPWIPTLGWFIAAADAVGIAERTALSFVWWLLLTAGWFLIIGVAAKPAAVLSWLLHVCAAKSGALFAYGADQLMTIGLFYLMLSPLPDRFALEARWVDPSPSRALLSGCFRRLLQLHLCLIYFFGGLSKLLGSGWWDGSNMWRALTRPPFGRISPEWIAQLGWLLIAMGILICVIEFAYPLFIWHRRTRKLWLVLVCGMHAGIAVTMGMYLFSLIMIVVNTAAFGPGLQSWHPASKPAR